jgi:two-component system response regulator NreC
MSGHPTTSRIVIADDHAVVREGIRRMLEQVVELELVGEASSGSEALRLCEAHGPDVVVLDITMPDLTGLEVCRRLKEQEGAPAVLILSMHDRPQYILEAVRSGADGYVLKDDSPARLREALRTVAGGSQFFPPTVQQQLARGVRKEQDAQRLHDRLEALSAREKEVLQGVARGQTNREIADSMGISHRTVEAHRESLMSKLEIRTIAGLTRFAVDVGLDLD